ncbi:E3 ubiquitin-protein ligase Midline-1-like isoform X3 [Ostrea edulis]|uniref:E3 ubiquitin-protein ligase Midline-1-like isoform X3 n=1 Tax=Ostrea edulis TaxID=37623 RepID=UPI0024AF6363|nr:E3 ubiquitin-protein ligase Midline-1-like isoform X3 [Ostrea edulis]
MEFGDAFLFSPVNIVATNGNHAFEHVRVAPEKSPVKAKMDVDCDLQCPICLELFSYPIILPCSHVLCRSPCAEHLFDFNFIRCPVCRDNCYVSGGISSLPRVIALENIIERYKADRSTRESSESAQENTQDASHLDTSISSQSDAGNESSILCHLCNSVSKKKAKKSCLDCNVSYCSNCLLLTHQKKDPFNTHELVSPRDDFNRSLTGLCSNHAEQLTLYCKDCYVPTCTACKDSGVHKSHVMITIDDAYTDIKASVVKNLQKLGSSQDRVTSALHNQRDNLKEMQQKIDRKRSEINAQCDMLLAEIENKRSFFLADLEYEERIRQNEQEELIKVMERILGSSQALHSYTSEVLNEDVSEFLEVANPLSEKLVKATVDCETAQFQPAECDVLPGKLVDFRKEKNIIREMNYLLAPVTPSIDVTRCSRSEDTVVLVLSPPRNAHDVINQYEIHYCSEEQKSLEIEDTLIVKNVPEDRLVGKNVPNCSGVVVVLVENLCKSTTYYFCVSASNQAGRSANSEVVQCTTLLPGESVIPVPVIVESLCRQFATSVQIYSSSPQDVASEQHISHFLLYRPLGQSRAWKTLSLYGRQDHRVFGLMASSEYEFLILGCNQRGECQVSNRVIVQTEQS